MGEESLDKVCDSGKYFSDGPPEAEWSRGPDVCVNAYEHQSSKEIAITEKDLVSEDDADAILLDVENKLELERSPYHTLEGRRSLLTTMYNDFIIRIHEGTEVYFIDPDWINCLLKNDFDKSDPNIEAKIGPMQTAVSESFIEGNADFFFPEDIFFLLQKWYGLAKKHLVIKRQYILHKKKLILDLSPLLISPHVLGLSAATASRVARLRIEPFQISSYKTISALKTALCEIFGLDSDRKDIRLWFIEYENGKAPTIFNVSSLVNIGVKEQINMKKSRSKLLNEYHLSSGDYLVEVKGDGSYLLDLSNQISIGTGTLGLSNLGNTCYMNSALQCITHVPELSDYFMYRFYESEINRNNPLGYHGKIASAFADLITNMYDRRYSIGHSSYSPREFKYAVGHYNSTFADYSQQDSQEFIAFLLDAIHEDLNRVINKPYVEKPELAPDEHTNTHAIKNLAQRCLDAHKLRNDSIVGDLFASMYKSTLICPDCEHVSITFDPYNQLTLPLPIVKMWTHKIKILPEIGHPMVLEVQLPQTSTYTDLKHYVCAQTNISELNLFGFEIHQQFTYRNFEDPKSVSRYLPLSSMINPQDDIWFYEVNHDSQNDIILPVYSTVKGEGNYVSSHLFSIPFFISLSPFERTDFSSILKKVLLKYKQLSTAPIILELAAIEKGQYNKSDFPDIDEFMRLNNLRNDCASNDTCWSSLIGTASPNLTFDEKFEIKVVDSVPSTMYGYSRYGKYGVNGQSNDNENSEDFKIWTPAVPNIVTRKNNKSLINHLNLKSKAFFFYTPERLEISRKAHERASRSLNEDHISVNETNITEIETNSKENVDLNVNDTVLSADSEDIISAEEDEKDEEMADADDKTYSLNNNGEVNDDDASNEIASSNEKLCTNDSHRKSALVADSIPAINSTSNNEKENDEESKIARGETKSQSSQYQICLQEKNGLVIEWDAEWFNNCFCDMGDADFISGRETLSDLQLITNEQLESEKREAEERAKRTITLYDCLDMFSTSEVLGQNDLWRCPKCKEEKQATKKIELWSTPDILIIHLKRFESSRSFSGKIDATIDFPIEGLDLSEQVAVENDEYDKNVFYDLFAVDNHYGGIGGGHYTAYVKNFVDNNWYYFNDSNVRPVSDPTESITGNAYLLFYRKRGADPLGGEKINSMYERVEKERADVETTLHKLQNEEELAMLTDSSECSFEERPEEKEPLSPPKLPSLEDMSYRTPASSDTISVCESDDGLKRRKVELKSPSSQSSIKTGKEDELLESS